MAPPKVSPAMIALEKANKKYNSSVGWFSSSSTKYEDAAELYEQAGNLFMIDKLFMEAGHSFMKQAECREQAGEMKEFIAKSFSDAANAYKQAPDLDKALGAYEQASTVLAQAGKRTQAADRERDRSQLFLELSDISNAAKCLVKAAELYAMDNRKVYEFKSKREAADLYAELGCSSPDYARDSFPRAISYYLEVADHYSKERITENSVKENLLRAGLCALASEGGSIEARKQYKQWQSQPSKNKFFGTSEERFFLELIDSIEAGDGDKYTETVRARNELLRMDGWTVSILLKIKKGLEEEPGLL